MTLTQIGGIDPGLVHTGCVVIQLDHLRKHITVRSQVVVGPDAAEAASFMGLWVPDLVTIEGYRRRSNFGTDPEMTSAIARFKLALPQARVLDNMGVKQVVTRELMELLGVWKFKQMTNHQDLRSAARIGIFGALKDDRLNAALAEVVEDHLAGNSWPIC